MKISILTLFPEMFIGPMTLSIIKRAQDKNVVDIQYINIRDFGLGKHRVVDDTAYGGGVGMVMRVDVMHKAIEHARDPKLSKQVQRVVLLDPRGKTFTQKKAETFSKLDHLILICGHYEGYDERIRHFIDEEVSIGDFVLTGGEIPTMAIVDATIRLLPGVLRSGSAETESFSGKKGFLEAPTYTKPPVYQKLGVPEILFSGNHAKIEAWKEKQSFEITNELRPDLLS